MELQMLLTAIIAFCAVFTSLGLMFNILLRPVKVNQDRMESEIKELKLEVAEIKSKLDQLLARS